MRLFSLWFVSRGDEDLSAPLPVDLVARTDAEAVLESRCLWMKSSSEGLRVYEDISGRLVYEIASVLTC
jgi:hypothetical protein